MSRAPLAWTLNLDAELELEAGASHTPSAALTRATDEARARLRAMLPAGDVVLEIDPDPRGLEGRCFCPTPSALARLERAGARLPDAPSVTVLRLVNERGFAFALHHLDGAVRCTDEAEVERALTRPGRWLLKRGFTFAGRGQRPIDPPLTEPDRAWIRASLRRGALYIEPRLTITLEVALHGLLASDGSVERGTPTVQRVDGGAWRESRRIRPDELHADERAQLDETFDRVAAQLHRAGYFGPFGIDAFRFTSTGGERFQPLSELNARYTMAWGTGMGAWR